MRRNFAIYLTILSVCLLSGIAVLLFGSKLPPFQHIDSWVFKNTSSTIHHQKYLLADYNGSAPQRHLNAVDDQHVDTLPLSILDFNLNSNKLNTSIPPTASDVALVLDELRNDGVEHIHFTTQFHREETEGVLNHLVKQVFSEKNTPAFKSVLIPLEFTRSAKQQDLPQYLKPCTIPTAKITGDANAIPTVNKVIYSPVDGVNFSHPSDIPTCVQFGFTNLESEQAPEGKTFLLARWNDHVILHQLLLSTLALADLSINDVTIELGNKITLGPNGPSFPIDQFGCGTITIPAVTPPTPTQADNLFDDDVDALTGDQSNSSQTTFQPHVLITSTPQPNISIQLVDQPYQKLHGLFQTPAFTRALTYYRLPPWLEACILVEFTLICASFYVLRGSNRHLAYALLLAALWPLSTMLLSSAGYWMPISPILIIILTGWGVSTYLSTKWNLRRPTSTTTKEGKKQLTRFD